MSEIERALWQSRLDLVLESNPHLTPYKDPTQLFARQSRHVDELKASLQALAFGADEPSK